MGGLLACFIQSFFSVTASCLVSIFFSSELHDSRAVLMSAALVHNEFVLQLVKIPIHHIWESGMQCHKSMACFWNEMNLRKFSLEFSSPYYEDIISYRTTILYWWDKNKKLHDTDTMSK